MESNSSLDPKDVRSQYNPSEIVKRCYDNWLVNKGITNEKMEIVNLQKNGAHPAMHFLEDLNKNSYEVVGFSYNKNIPE